MPIARSIEETFPYVLEAERGKDGATTFTLGVLSASANEHKIIALYQASAQADGVSEKLRLQGEAGDEVLRSGGLRGWDLKDAAGKPVVLVGKGGAADMDLRRLLVRDRSELGWVAFKRSNLISDEQD